MESKITYYDTDALYCEELTRTCEGGYIPTKIYCFGRTYEAWVMMSPENDVVSNEYDTPEEALNEMLEEMSIEELRLKGYTLNKLLCTSGCYLECLEEIEY